MSNPPTAQQIEAYRFVYIHDCTHAEAAKLMGLKSRSSVTWLLKRLKKTHPHLFFKKRTFKTFQFDCKRDYRIVKKF